MLLDLSQRFESLFGFERSLSLSPSTLSPALWTHTSRLHRMPIPSRRQHVVIQPGPKVCQFWAGLLPGLGPGARHLGGLEWMDRVPTWFFGWVLGYSTSGGTALRREGVDDGSVERVTQMGSPVVKRALSGHGGLHVKNKNRTLKTHCNVPFGT